MSVSDSLFELNSIFHRPQCEIMWCYTYLVGSLSIYFRILLKYVQSIMFCFVHQVQYEVWGILKNELDMDPA